MATCALPKCTKNSLQNAAVTHINAFEVLIISMLGNRETFEVWVRRTTQKNKDRAFGENLHKAPIALHAYWIQQL